MSHFVHASVSFYPPDRGGRHFLPIGDGYSPYLRTTALPEDAAVRLIGMPPDGKHDVIYRVDLELLYHPRVDRSPLVPGTAFFLIEGPKVIGEGTVLSPILHR